MWNECFTPTPLFVRKGDRAMKRLLKMTEAEREIVVFVGCCVFCLCALFIGRKLLVGKPVVAPVAYEWVWEMDKDNWGGWRKRRIE